VLDSAGRWHRPPWRASSASGHTLVRRRAVGRSRGQGRHAHHSPTDVALFRYAIIAPLLSITGPRGTLQREIKRLAAKQHLHPRRGPIAVGVGTIEEWLMRYRRGGLDGLEDSRRSDLGRTGASTPMSPRP
jgi:hypothetical protein